MKLYEIMTPCTVEPRVLEFLLNPAVAVDYDPHIVTELETHLRQLLQNIGLEADLQCHFDCFFDFLTQYSQFTFNNTSPDPQTKSLLLNALQEKVDWIKEIIERTKLLEVISNLTQLSNDCRRQEIEDELAASPPIQYR